MDNTGRSWRVQYRLTSDQGSICSQVVGSPVSLRVLYVEVHSLPDFPHIQHAVERDLIIIYNVKQVLAACEHVGPTVGVVGVNELT